MTAYLKDLLKLGGDSLLDCKVMPLQPGTTLGHYDVTAKIGRRRHGHRRAA